MKPKPKVPHNTTILPVVPLQEDLTPQKVLHLDSSCCSRKTNNELLDGNLVLIQLGQRVAGLSAYSRPDELETLNTQYIKISNILDT